MKIFIPIILLLSFSTNAMISKDDCARLLFDSFHLKEIASKNSKSENIVNQFVEDLVQITQKSLGHKKKDAFLQEIQERIHWLTQKEQEELEVEEENDLSPAMTLAVAMDDNLLKPKDFANQVDYMSYNDMSLKLYLKNNIGSNDVLYLFKVLFLYTRLIKATDLKVGTLDQTSYFRRFVSYYPSDIIASNEAYQNSYSFIKNVLSSQFNNDSKAFFQHIMNHSQIAPVNHSAFHVFFQHTSIVDGNKIFIDDESIEGVLVDKGLSETRISNLLKLYEKHFIESSLAFAIKHAEFGTTPQEYSKKAFLLSSVGLSFMAIDYMAKIVFTIAGYIFMFK